MTAAPIDRPARTEDLETVSLTIDGVSVEVPKGTLIIRAAEQMGVQIPRFCDHPLLAPVGACRQCLVEVEGQRKPVASCTAPVAESMVVRTQRSSVEAAAAQHGVMELLLINHPLDCPVCDKGGECPLQNQAMSTGRTDSRFTGTKRTFTKPLPLSPAVLLDRERCVLCARCTRFSDQIAGDPLIDLADRGALQQVGIYADEPFSSYFSGNTVQICPVGALTGTTYRFRARPFDLVSTPSVCEHCASGCAQRTDHRRGVVLRRLAGNDPEVNEEWNCDKGRWAFAYTHTGADTEGRPDRLTTPLVRDADGDLREASWAEALSLAALGLRTHHGTGVLTGGRLSAEDAYAYSRFTRTVLRTNDIDFRTRPVSDEETFFLTDVVAGSAMTLTYDDLSAASSVLLAGFEPEEESPIVFLRLRRAVRERRLPVTTIAPYVSRGTSKLAATLIPTVPGQEAEALAQAARHLPGDRPVILIGERLATAPGAIDAAVEVARRVGAALAWIPRRAGDRGALEVGALPTLLPGGRRVDDPTDRGEISRLWGVASLPGVPGRDTTHILGALATGTLGSALVAGVDVDDLPDPVTAEKALAKAGFVVSMELRRSAVTELADVIFPVASVAEKSGTFVDWEGRPRPFETSLIHAGTLPEHRILHALAASLGVDLDCDSRDAILDQLAAIPTRASRPAGAERPHQPPVSVCRPTAGQAVLSTWRMLLDAGRMQDGEPNLAATAHPAVVRLSSTTAAEIGAADQPDATVRVRSAHGSITLPLVITDMPDRVVWLPENSDGSHVRRTLRVGPGAVVGIAKGDS